MPQLPTPQPPKPPPIPEDLITLERGAEICTVSYETFRRWVAKGVVAHWKVGPNNLMRVSESDVRGLLRFVDRGE